MKTNLSFLFLILILTASFSEAKWVDFGSGGGTDSAQPSWSWNSIKATVTEKITTWFKTDAAAPVVAVGAPVASPVRAPAAVEYKPSVSIQAAKVSMTKTVETIKNINPAGVRVKAVPFKDKMLVMGRNNIPVFEFKKFKAHVLAARVRKVPLLNVGTEDEVDKIDLSPMEPTPVVKAETMAELPEPDLLSASKFKDFLGEPIVAALPPEKIEIPVLEAQKKVTPEKVAALVYTIVNDVLVVLLPVTKINAEDLKMLRAMILFEKKDQCHIASGIFSDLTESQNQEIKESARFHLGVCLHEMNLPTESLHYLTKVIRSGDTRFMKLAIKSAVEDNQLQHENEIAEALLTIVDASQIAPENEGDVDYLKAKYFFKKGQYQKAFDHAVRVSNKSSRYYKAQYLAAVSDYSLGRLDGALSRQKEVAAELAKKGSNKEVLALMQVNLGRVAFQKGRFKESLEAFQKVPKDHPLWMQALTEQAWSQLQMKDSAGAIGNMHSIHSPYFETVFKPESYIVRGIGYLAICQYADAFKSLAYFDHKYLPWLDKIDTYNQNHHAPQVYQTIVKYLSGKSNADVDGVPFQALREVARQRDFLNSQEGINQLIDESGGYAFVKKLIEKDKASLLARRNATITKITQLELKLKKARTTPGAMKNFNAWRFELANYEDFLSIYEFKVQTLKEGLEGVQKLTPIAQKRIADAKETLKETAGKTLKSHMNKLAKNLKQNIENNELIKYEIYADSGENIRYQVAGGKVGNPSKRSSERKPTGMNWDFDGEFWEDEIGNYRSSLKNNCQNVQAAQAKGGS